MFRQCFTYHSCFNSSTDIETIVLVDIELFALFSGKVVVELSKHALIQAAVLCHPSLVTVDDIKGKIPVLIFRKYLHHYWNKKLVSHSLYDLFLDLLSEVKVPISILGAEIDQMAPPEVVKQFEEVLTAKPEVGISFIRTVINTFVALLVCLF